MPCQTPQQEGRLNVSVTLPALLRVASASDVRSLARRRGDAMKVWFIRTLTGCKPDDEASAAVIAKFPVGTSFEADVVTRKNRSGAWHRRYWVLCSMLASNLDRVEIEPGLVLPITDSESAHVALKYATGCYDSYAIKGGVVRLLKSTAFDRMDADEWAAHWKRVLDAVHQKFLPGIESRMIEDEIARLAS